MTKHTWVIILSVVFILAFGVAAALSFSGDDRGRWGRSERHEERGTMIGGGSEHGTGMLTALASEPVGELDLTERADLLFVFEEEKMSRDIYTLLGGTYGWRTIGHVSRSEQMHMSAAGALLDRYDIPEPKETPIAGKYADPTIQALYDRLIAEGAMSAEAAIKVGLYVEEFDIADLRTRIAHTDNADIKKVYDYLLLGSYMHLRHFDMRLQEIGGAYSPSVLSQADYDAALASGGGMMGGMRSERNSGKGMMR